MHTPAPRTPAVAAMVVVVKEPMLLLHHMSMTFFCNEAQSTALSSSHDFHLLQKQEHSIQCGRSCSASGGGPPWPRWWWCHFKAPMLLLHHISLTLFCNDAKALLFSSSHDSTSAGDPRSTCGTGRAVREVPSIQQVPLLSMSRDLTTHKRARPTVDWARETSARRTCALQTRDQHAALVARLERCQGPGRWFAGRTARPHTPYVTAPRLLRPKVDSALSASHERVY